MASAGSDSRRLRFSDWEVDPTERVLFVRGSPTEVGRRAFDLLLALIHRDGSVATKQELLDEVWRGLVVEENNISVQVAALRKLLGSNAIATVSAIGYRLTAPRVQALPSSVATPAPPHRRAAADIATISPADASLLVGRNVDVNDLTRRLQADSGGLISIIGAGGVGKTALAKSVCATLTRTVHRDIHWIDLGALRDASQFVPLVAKTIGVELAGFAQNADTLRDALFQVDAVIAVDNCEHLLDEVADFIAKALRVAPDVHWLVTSQEPLRIHGEVVYALSPLEVPPDDAPFAQARPCGAIELLWRRARDADRHFELTESNLPIAVDLCRKLDGLPLAIEMAASRMAALGLQGVHAQLDHRLRFLSGARGAPARHHTLRSTFDWSYGLLSEVEQRVFRRLEPFVDGFCMEVACDVARGLDDNTELADWQAQDIVMGLVDKSLIYRVPNVSGRFSLYESARAYAGEQLARTGETDRTRRRHARAVARWFSTAQRDFAIWADEKWHQRYVPERANVLQALASTHLADEPDDLALLAAALAQIDAFLQSPSEIVRCDVPMRVLEQARAPLRAAANLEISWAHYTDGNRDIGTGLALRALDDYRSIGDAAGEYRALAQLIRLYESRPGTLEQARKAWQLLGRIDSRQFPLRLSLSATIAAGLQYERNRSVEQLRELENMAHRSGFDVLAGVCRAGITDQLLVEGRFDEAVVAAREVIAGGEIRLRLKGLILSNLVLALVQLDRLDEARGAALAAVRVLPSATYVVIDSLALAAARHGRLTDAAMLAGYAGQVRLERDESPDPAERAVIEETTQRLEEQLEPARLTDLRRTGAAMDARSVMALALS